MHFHQKSTQFSNSIKVLLILLFTYTTYCNAVNLSNDDVDEAMRELILDSQPLRYCGRRLTIMMKFICRPDIRDAITGNVRSAQKKSLIPNTGMNFHAYDLNPMESYDDEDMSKTRYKLSDIEEFMPLNDLQYISSQQGKNRARRGIIETCCKRACLKQDLIQFCPSSLG